MLNDNRFIFILKLHIILKFTISSGVAKIENSCWCKCQYIKQGQGMYIVCMYLSNSFSFKS